MLPFLQKKEASVSVPAESVMRKSDGPKEDTVISDLQLAHDLINSDTDNDLALAKALIKSAMESIQRK